VALEGHSRVPDDDGDDGDDDDDSAKRSRALAIGLPPRAGVNPRDGCSRTHHGARRHIFFIGARTGRARSTCMHSQFLLLAIAEAAKGVEKGQRDAGAIRASWKPERAALIRNANATSVANDVGGGGGEF